MSPYAICGWCLLAVLVTMLLPLVFSPKRKQPELPRFRDGGIIGFAEPDMLKRYDARKYAAGPLTVRRPSIFLTPRQLERVNTHRKLRDREPLNRKGFISAVTRGRLSGAPLTTVSDWMTYLILYECLLAEHSTGRVYVDRGLTIEIVSAPGGADYDNAPSSMNPGYDPARWNGPMVGDGPGAANSFNPDDTTVQS